MRSSQLKRTVAVAAVGAAALALTGCGTTTGTQAGTQAAASPVSSATKATITWWSWTPDNDVAAREITAFNKQYPGIQVTYKKVPIDNYAAILRPALSSNDGPDVYTVNASGSFSGQTFAPYAYDLTAAMTKQLGADWKSKVFPGGTSAWTVKGKLVASEWGKTGAGILWINQDVFTRYGLKPPKDLAQWKTLCATFRSKGLGCFREGIAGTAGFVLDTLHSIADNIEPGAWTDALAGKRKWTDPVFVQSLQMLQTLATEKILDPGAVGIMQYPDVNNAFLSGKVPMVQMGTWYTQYATDTSLTSALQGAGVASNTKKVTIVPVPFPDLTGKGNPPTLFADPDAGQSVNAKSKNRDAAVTFALWLGASTQGAQVVANNVDTFPTLKGVGPQWDGIGLVNKTVQLPLVQKLTLQLQNATEPRSNGLGAQTSQAIINASQAVVSGKSPAAQVGAIQQAADQDKQGH